MSKRLYVEARWGQGLHLWWKDRGVHIFLRKGCLERRVIFERGEWP